MLNKLTNRILIGYCIPILFLRGVGLTVYLTTLKISELQDELQTEYKMLRAEEELTYGVSRMVRNVRGYLVFPGDRSYIESYNAGYQGFRKAADELQKLVADPKQKQAFEILNSEGDNYHNGAQEVFRLVDEQKLAEAIEAEKAGEYGTGFAVVAREIRRLADQTSVATLDIENMVKEMQGAVSTGVMEMDKFTKDVERGVEDVQNIGTKLESIIEKVQILTPRFQQVSNNMESQSQGASQISEAMVQLSEAASQTAGTLREINGAIAQLNKAAQGLRQKISGLQADRV